MLAQICDALVYGAILLSLFFIDYILGNGFVDVARRVFCKIACFVKRSLRDEAMVISLATEKPISLYVLFAEILTLSLTIAILKKYKNTRGKDRMDELLQESREALRQTNEFLEKWRLRRINEFQLPPEYSYLDEEPQEIKPHKLEVPILHMAIIDTLGTTRSQPERGDAGDTINITDSTLLSVTSLLDDEVPSQESLHDLNMQKPTEETKQVEFRSRFLWDVMEEDAANIDD